MIGDVAAAVRGMKLHAHLLQHAAAGAQVLALAVASERNHVRMLAEQQHVGNGIGFAGLAPGVLQIAGRAIGDQPRSTIQQVCSLASRRLLG